MDEKTVLSADTLILAVSFGTSYHETRQATIGAIEDALREAFPQYEVRRAFTSQMIINKLKKRDNLHIDNVKEALDRAAADGFRHLILQPTHLMDGLEYNDVREELKEYESVFDSVALGAPLLDSDQDFSQVIRTVTDATKAYCDGRTAVAFMGHGSEAEANGVYTRLQEILRAEGFDQYFIGTVEAEPDLGHIMEMMKENGQYERVVLQPLMVVAGDHATNDMAGDDEDSWKSVLTGEGYQVECVLKGLGELEAIRQMYVDHARTALNAAVHHRA